MSGQTSNAFRSPIMYIVKLDLDLMMLLDASLYIILLELVDKAEPRVDFSHVPV